MTEDVAYLSAVELIRLYRSKQLSPVEAGEAALARIREHGQAVNAFCLVDEESALRAARESQARWLRGAPCGLLDGVPVTVKDLLLTRGWPTRRGSVTIDPEREWPDDAPAVSRLREHGAVLLGKTTTPEFGWKGVTDSRLTGVTRNPWNLTKTPGGSSGGAAAACALGLGTLHIGTDGGGSIRIPAGFTGVFGHKPSFGRVPAWPLSPFGTVAHVGPITRTVSDAALMLTVLAQPDDRDWHALPYDGRDYRIGLEAGVRGLRIAFSPDLGYARVDPEVAEAVRHALGVLEELGAHVEEVPPPFGDPTAVFRTHWYTGAAKLLAGFGEAQRAEMDPGLVEIAAEAEGYSLSAYLDAVAQRAALGESMRAFHRTFDLLVTPTLPVAAFDAGRETAEPTVQRRWSDWTPFSYPFNLTQQPACSVPCGFTNAGLPMGMQIVGPMHDDARVLQAARAFESLRPFRLPHEPRSSAMTADAARGVRDAGA